MNKRIETFSRRILPTLAGALLVIGTLAGCASDKAATKTTRSCCREVTSATPLGDRSIYQLTSDWTTDTGNKIKLEQLRGRPQVVAMFFASCQYACPVLVHQMQELADSLPPNSRTNVGFLLVTFDTERDTPTVLHTYRATRNLAAGQWTLLHGRPEDVRELALVLGVKYRQDASGQFSHSNLITILNAGGEIAFQQSGLENSTDALTKQIALLLKP